jgi:hypothetical protein
MDASGMIVYFKSGLGNARTSVSASIDLIIPKGRLQRSDESNVTPCSVKWYKGTATLEILGQKCLIIVSQIQELLHAPKSAGYAHSLIEWMPVFRVSSPVI